MQKPIYVIAGKEESLVDAECDGLLDRLIKLDQRTTGLLKADANQVSASEVFDELRTAPFLSAKRVVLIKGADSFISENRGLLEKYFDNPCPTGILVLTVHSWPSQTKLAKKLSHVGELIQVDQPKRGQLPRRLIEYASDAHRKRLTKDAADLLIELTGEDVVRLYREIDKLALFAVDEKGINQSHVESLVGHNRIFGAFEAIDAVIAGDTARAIDRLRNMFAEDRSAEYTIVGAFAFHFRRMYTAKVLLEKGAGPAEVAKRLRLWANKDKFFRQLRQLSLEEIAANIKQLAAIDYATKTGRATADVAIEKFLLGLTTGSANLKVSP